MKTLTLTTILYYDDWDNTSECTPEVIDVYFDDSKIENRLQELREHYVKINNLNWVEDEEKIAQAYWTQTIQIPAARIGTLMNQVVELIK